MRIAYVAACVAAVGLGFGMTAASANADEVATMTTCVNLADQVRAAVDANHQAANLVDAQHQRMYGREFCNNGFYDRGAAHYTRALQLLGAPQKS